MTKEIFLSEALLRDNPKRKLYLKLGDKSVTTDKLADKSVTAEKLAIGLGTPNGIATLDSNGNVLASQLGNVRDGVIPSISIDKLDSLCTSEIVASKVPSIYNVLNSITPKDNVGILFIFGDGVKHIVTQILFTHLTPPYTNVSSSHNDTELRQYYRIYNNHAPHATWPIGTWSKWKPYIEPEIEKTLNIFGNVLSQLSKLEELSVEEVTNIWENN